MTQAFAILRNNKINRYVFAAALFDLLQKGRGKHRNVMVVGPADTGKTFILNPLSKVFSGAFCNLCSSRFAWIGAEEADVIFLNDYRWRPEQISWQDFLRLLEADQVVHLPAPMNTHARNIEVASDVPIFATSIDEIKKFNRAGEIMKAETEMMSVRWKVFRFEHVVPKQDQVELPPCPVCFSKLVLMGRYTG